ncbi:hypothetical protein JXA05_04610 [Candidatus Peregrinibacteria bacterium]|nr:hypothetical protein [Candidatus Peregrinibacteria bacterium]
MSINKPNPIGNASEAEIGNPEKTAVVVKNRSGIRMLLAALGALALISAADPAHAKSLKEILSGSDNKPASNKPASKVIKTGGSKAPDNTALQIKQIQEHIWGVGNVPPLPIPPVDGFLGGKCKDKGEKCGGGLTCSATTGRCEGTQGSMLSSCRTPKKAEKEGENDVTACDGELVCTNNLCIPDPDKNKSVEERLKICVAEKDSLVTVSSMNEKLAKETQKAAEKANKDYLVSMIIAAIGSILGALGMAAGGLIAWLRGRRTREDIEEIKKLLEEDEISAQPDDDDE